MRMRVDQAGHQRAPASVDRESTRRRDLLGGDGLDQVADDENRSAFDQLFVLSVEDVHIREQDLARRAFFSVGQGRQCED